MSSGHAEHLVAVTIARNAGFLAAEKGTPREDCPHVREGDPLRRAWLRGWDHANLDTEG